MASNKNWTRFSVIAIIPRFSLNKYWNVQQRTFPALLDSTGSTANSNSIHFKSNDKNIFIELIFQVTIGMFLSAGFLWLFLYWIPRRKVQMTHKVVPLEEADTVLVEVSKNK